MTPLASLSLSRFYVGLHHSFLFSEFIKSVQFNLAQTDLSALFTFSLFRPPVNPVMVGSGLLAILTHSYVPKCWFTR